MASVFTLLFLSLLPVALSLSHSHSTAPAPPPAPSFPPPTPPPSSPPRKPLTSPPPSPPRKPPNPPPSPPARRTPSTTPPPVPPPQHRPNVSPASKPQPPPTPPVPASAPEDRPQMDNIADALIGSGDFGNWISLLTSAVKFSSLPINATIFVPDDVALPQPKNPDPFPNQVDFDPFLFPYHVVPQRLLFADLRALAVGSRLPTLLPGNSLLITNNSFANFTINDTPITHPDLYLRGAVSVQGVGDSLDYKRFGTEEFKTRPAQPPRAPPHRSRGIHPGFTFFPGQMGGGTRISGSNFFFGHWIPLVFGFGVLINTIPASIR